MGKVIMSGIVPQLVAPVTEIMLSELAEGSIVKLNEDGSPVEFYVAKHNYESGLNGTGRTLLVRKSIHSERKYDAGDINLFDGSDIEVWLNGTYKNLFDSAVQTAMGTTKFYYTKSRSGDDRATSSVGTLSRSVFLLSAVELGLTAWREVPTEGSKLPTVDTIRKALGSNEIWTRTPQTTTTHNVWVVTSGTDGAGYASTTSGVRPCFTLPATALFDESTLLFKGVA